MVKWFVLENDEVRGPFSEAQIQAQLDSQIISPKTHLWTKGMRTWAKADAWKAGLKDQVLTPGQAEKMRMWHFAFEGQAHGPMSHEQLITRLGTLGERVNEALLWTKGMKNWSPLFEFHDLLDALDINKRQHPRAPIDGQVIIRIGDTQIIGPLRSISQGGFGVGRLEGIVTGQEVHAELRSPAFAESINVKAELRYLGDSGYAGFSFTAVHREAVSQIIQFIKGQSKQQIAA